MGGELPAALAATGRLIELPLGRIEPNPRQPRKRFPAEQIEALAESIRAQGVIHPLVVRPHPEAPQRYQLVAGERRLRAVRLLGWQWAPALVREVPDEQLLETALVENLQREELTPIEEATAYRTLLDQYGYTQDTLAGQVGKDRSTIANLVRLLSLPLSLQEDLEAGGLTTGHARALLAIPEPDRQVALRNVIVERGLSVRETERLVNRARKSRTNATDGRLAEQAGGVELPAGLALQFQAVQEMLERRFSTRVIIRRGEEGNAATEAGRIEIEFYSLDDFNRLYELLVR